MNFGSVKQAIRRANSKLSLIGIDAIKLIHFILSVPYYIQSKNQFLNLNNNMNTFIWKYNPQLEDRYLSSGTASGHYFHQDLLIANKIFKNKPVRHVDVGSRIDGFIAHVASFRGIEVMDIRDQQNSINNVIFLKNDLMGELNENYIDCCDSLSCLHALEHFGLGRYGDQIDPYGHLRGLENLYKILKINGTLYLSVPMGQQRIEFNAHRVFSLKYLLNLFQNKFLVKSFSYVDDSGLLHEKVEFNQKNIENNFNCNYGCAIFELTKI